MLDVMFRIGNEDLLNQVGMGREEQSAVAESESNKISVLASQVEEEIETAGCELTEVASE
jgi:hypothetical protein